MIIRLEPIKENDFEILLSLFEEFANFEKMPDKMTNTLQKMKDDKDLIKGFVARDGENNIIGYTTYFYAYYTWVGKSLYMDDLYVREKSRKQGIGTMLVSKVIDLAKTENCNRLRWQVSNWNHSAIKFYENLGAVVNQTEMNCDLML